MAAMRILVIDDDEEMLGIAASALEPSGYRVEQVLAGESGLQAVATCPPDLILLDVVLPGRSGLEICKRLRARECSANIPVILLTARNGAADIQTGMDAGADHYLVKPVAPMVLLAYVRATLRRHAANPHADFGGSEPPERHGLAIHPRLHVITYQGCRVELSATEFKLIQVLFSHPGWVYSRDQLIDAVHAGDATVTDRCIDVQISTLRRKMGPAGALVETVRGVGYRFRA